MDGVIKAYKDFWWIMCRRPLANFSMLFFFVLCHYIIAILYHNWVYDIEFPEVFSTAAWATLRLWGLIALCPAIVGIGG